MFLDPYRDRFRPFLGFDAQHGIEASEEGGNPLTDSPAVELILSLFVLADHPDHSVAWFHLRTSLLKDHVAGFANAEALAVRLRSELLTQGYGRFTQAWAERLAPAGLLVAQSIGLLAVGAGLVSIASAL